MLLNLLLGGTLVLKQSLMHRLQISQDVIFGILKELHLMMDLHHMIQYLQE